MNSVSFFMGANTPEGFYSLFDDLYYPDDGWKIYIIKGGPGTGKSTLMKKLAAEAENKGYFIERIYCSSDPNSLDALIIPEIKISIADGTSPHIIEPKYPGVCETIINLGDCWNKTRLDENINEIMRITKLNSSHHKQCTRYLKAAGIINDEIYSTVDRLFNQEKADRFIERIKKEILIKSNDDYKTKSRFLSAFTPEGITVNYNSIISLCSKTYCLKDDCTVASDYIINRISDLLSFNGVSYIKCMNPLKPERAEHLILPDAGICFFTSNSYHPSVENNNSNINCTRFYDKEKLAEIRNRVVFLKKAKLEFINEAIICLKNAKATHDILESYYIAAMDFNKTSEISNKLMNDIFNVSRETSDK